MPAVPQRFFGGEHPPRHLSRQGSAELWWAAFEAAKCAVGAILWITPSIKPAAKHDGKNPPCRVAQDPAPPLSHAA